MQMNVPRPESPERREPLRGGSRLGKPPQPVGEILRESDLNAAHALDSAYERELLAPVPEHPGRLERRHHACRAGEHRRKRRNGLVEARLDLDLARDVGVAEVGYHRAPDEEVGPDTLARDPGARLREMPRRRSLEPGHGAHHRHRQLDRAEPGERAVHARERRAQARREPEVWRTGVQVSIVRPATFPRPTHARELSDKSNGLYWAPYGGE